MGRDVIRPLTLLEGIECPECGEVMEADIHPPGLEHADGWICRNHGDWLTFDYSDEYIREIVPFEPPY